MANRSAKETKGRSSRRSRGTDRREVEWQYEAEELDTVEGWLEDGEHAGIRVVEGSVKELADTYYDTEDWRLHRAGYALRMRRGGSRRGAEATMKSLVSEGDGSLHQRREISERLKSDEGDALREANGPVGERVRALTGARELRPIFEIKTHRRIFDLVQREAEDGASGDIIEDASGDVRPQGDGSRAAEVALDTSEISVGSETVGLRRVEVEVDPSAETGVMDLLEKFVEAMEEDLDLQPTAISKYQAGLLATGQSPQEDPDLGPETVDSSLSVGEVAFAVLRRQFTTMKAHEPGTRLGEDSEELHDMRVATRRMRAAIKFFQTALPEQARWLEAELKHFAGVLGEVRDLDVQIQQLQGWASEEEALEALPKITTTLEEQRSEARERLLEALDSDRYESFESSFAEMLRRGPDLEEDSMAAEPILDVAPDLLSRPYRKWHKAAKRLDSSSDLKEFHDLRKKGKRLRYALEFLTDVYGKDTTNKLVKPLKKLQDGLGDHQDAIVAVDLLEDLATGPRRITRRTAFAMGVLAGELAQQATSLRTSLPNSRAYRKLVKGRAWRRFEKDMKKAASKE